MKNKLFLINYTYKNLKVDWETIHHNLQYFLCKDSRFAINYIYEKYDGFEIKINQIEEICFTQID